MRIRIVAYPTGNEGKGGCESIVWPATAPVVDPDVETKIQGALVSRDATKFAAELGVFEDFSVRSQRFADGVPR